MGWSGCRQVFSRPVVDYCVCAVVDYFSWMNFSFHFVKS
jgi:hypothetical protein